MNMFQKHSVDCVSPANVAGSSLYVMLQYAEMQKSAGRFDDDLKSTRAEIADMNRRIMRLQSEIEMVKAQVRVQSVSCFCLFFLLCCKFSFDSQLLNLRNLLQTTKPFFVLCLILLSEKQPGGSDRRGRGARRAGRERCQAPPPRPGGSSAEGQTGHGPAGPPVPGTDECEAGSGHRNRYI